MTREELQTVFQDTLTIIEKNQKLKNNVSYSIRNTKVITGKRIERAECENLVVNNVSVTNHKTLEAAKLLHEEFPEKKIAILNFASATNPGGGVRQGASAQEESICRCSTLFKCLNIKKAFNEFYLPNRNNKARTAIHTDDIIYTPEVTILKDDTTYDILKNFFKVDVITCAAPNLREKSANPYNRDEKPAVKVTLKELLNIHINRARNILSAAVENNVDILVLGAFGCGAFKNDPMVVANAYRQVLPEYASKFTKIEFAVFCTERDKENFRVFKSILGESANEE